ncbi:MAG: hypothetical protein ACLPJH_05510 [Myxococcaceae bacterium]
MSHNLAVLLFVLGLFSAMVLLLKVGQRAGQRQLAKGAEHVGSGLGPLEGSLFGLLGLLVAFTFSGAASRFEMHRHFILEEANAVSAAYLRLDLLPASAQAPLREKFRDYLDARLNGYRLADADASGRAFARATLLQGDLWRQAVAVARDADGAQAARLLLPALNDVFAVATSRAVAAETHAPTIIFAMLALLALVCSLLAGYSMAKNQAHSTLQVVAFPFIFAVTVYVILDLEYPRAGLIRIDEVDQVLLDARRGMQ